MPELQTILTYRAWRTNDGEGRRFLHRSAGALGCHTRIRAGFPRDRSRTVFFIVARGPVPRDGWVARTMARDRPSPYGTARRFFSVARGPSDATRASELPRDRPSSRCVFPPSVVCDRLITNGSGAGDPALQGLAHERWRGEPSRMRVWHARALALR